MAKIGCFFLQLSNKELTNFQQGEFLAYNALNSFKKWHPEVEIHHVTNDNFQDYLTDLGIEEYYDNLGLIRIHFIKELIKQKGYTKFIMLGLDTFTCSYLDEFIENTTSDMICSSGPPYEFMGTEYWKPNVYEVEINGKKYLDVDFINADVACFNNYEIAELVYQKSLEYWTDQAEQGGINYVYHNQTDLGVKVDIVDFPYLSSKSLYNVRSKGIACGGNQMWEGKVYSGNYKDPSSQVVSEIYPTSEYYVKDNKLFTKDHKQIKVFHYAEALGVKTPEEYKETLDEIKKLWFNNKTKQFLIESCNCKF
jgi:hypothetical protein